MKELEEVASIKRRLMQLFAQKPGRRSMPLLGAQRQELDETLLWMRAARRAMKDAGCPLEQSNWLRTVRRAIGMPVNEVARRLGITKREVLRQERGEQSACIQLSTLRRAAEALGCELVYAVVPRVGSLEDLVEAQRKKAAAEQERAKKKNLTLEKEIDQAIGWQTVLNKAVRSELGKQGNRIL